MSSSRKAVLGVIPARGGSKGLPRKNIRSLRGLPLIAYTIRAAQESRLLTALVVSTDDAAIARAAREHGAEVPFKRPAAFATDKSSIWPAVLHACEFVEARRGRRFDAVALLQPTSPLRTGADIDGCIAKLWSAGADICVSVTPAVDSPYKTLVEPAGKGPFMRPCSPIMKRLARRQDAPKVYRTNGGVYVVRRESLRTLKSQFELRRFAAYEMPMSRSIDVDTQEDLDLAAWWLERSNGAGRRRRA